MNSQQRLELLNLVHHLMSPMRVWFGKDCLVAKTTTSWRFPPAHGDPFSCDRAFCELIGLQSPSLLGPEGGRERIWDQDRAKAFLRWGSPGTHRGSSRSSVPVKFSEASCSKEVSPRSGLDRLLTALDLLPPTGWQLTHLIWDGEPGSCHILLDSCSH